MQCEKKLYFAGKKVGDGAHWLFDVDDKARKPG